MHDICYFIFKKETKIKFFFFFLREKLKLNSQYIIQNNFFIWVTVNILHSFISMIFIK